MPWSKQELNKICQEDHFHLEKKKNRSFVEKKTIFRASGTNTVGALFLALPKLGPSSLTPCSLAPRWNRMCWTEGKWQKVRQSAQCQLVPSWQTTLPTVGERGCVYFVINKKQRKWQERREGSAIVMESEYVFLKKKRQNEKRRHPTGLHTAQSHGGICLIGLRSSPMILTCVKLT